MKSNDPVFICFVVDFDSSVGLITDPYRAINSIEHNMKTRISLFIIATIDMLLSCIIIYTGNQFNFAVPYFFGNRAMDVFPLFYSI